MCMPSGYAQSRVYVLLSAVTGKGNGGVVRFYRLAEPVFSPLSGPSVFAAWREYSIYAAWRGPILTPLGQLYPPFRPSGTFPRKRGKEKIPAWRAQCFRRLARPVFIPLGEASVYPAWRGQCLSRLARPVFIPLGGPSVYPAWCGPVFSPLSGPR